MQGEANRLRQDELSLLERDARLAPDNAAVQGRIGLSRYVQGWLKEAEHSLLLAHLLDPQNPEYAFNLAIYYRDTGRPREALPLVEQLLKLRPDSPLFKQLQSEMLEIVPPGPAP
jgi:tetratricopeptide (TPR) repeat protein